MKKYTIKRDLNILKNISREINLNTKVVRDKSKFNKKIKHKLKEYEINIL